MASPSRVRLAPNSGGALTLPQSSKALSGAAPVAEARAYAACVIPLAYQEAPAPSRSLSTPKVRRKTGLLHCHDQLASDVLRVGRRDGVAKFRLLHPVDTQGSLSVRLLELPTGDRDDRLLDAPGAAGTAIVQRAFAAVVDHPPVADYLCVTLMRSAPQKSARLKHAVAVDRQAEAETAE